MKEEEEMECSVGEFLNRGRCSAEYLRREWAGCLEHEIQQGFFSLHLGYFPFSILLCLVPSQIALPTMPNPFPSFPTHSFVTPSQLQ